MKRCFDIQYRIFHASYIRLGELCRLSPAFPSQERWRRFGNNNGRCTNMGESGPASYDVFRNISRSLHRKSPATIPDAPFATTYVYQKFHSKTYRYSTRGFGFHALRTDPNASRTSTSRSISMCGYPKAATSGGQVLLEWDRWWGRGRRAT